MTGTEMAIDKTKLEAQELHVQIMANGQLAASALLEFARGLKTMRDKRLYQALGYGEAKSRCLKMQDELKPKSDLLEKLPGFFDAAQKEVAQL